MNQLTIPMTPEFAASLASLMQARGVKTPEEAVKLAVRESAENTPTPPHTDLRKWVGIGCRAPQNPNPRFKSTGDLWE